MREACLMAKEALELSQVTIENKNSQIISLCSSDLEPPWEVEAIVKDIRILKQSSGFRFLSVRKNANRAAHWCAASAFYVTPPLNVSLSLPVELDKIILEDCPLVSL